MTLTIPEKPTGPISAAAHGLARLVAFSPSFGRARGVSTPHDALPHVKLFSFEEDPKVLKGQRPFAVVIPEKVDWTKYAGGAQNCLTASGSLQLILTANDPARHDESETEIDFAFAAWVDEILLDIVRLAGKEDFLPVTGIESIEPLVRRSATKDDPQGAYLWSVFTITWAGAGGGR